MQRKVFRVEQMFTRRGAAAHGGAATPGRDALRTLAACRDEAADSRLKGLEQEVALLRAAILANKREISALLGTGKDPRLTRSAGDLGAAIEGMEKATVTMLQSAEVIDDTAKSLASVLKGEYERGLAQDIQDQTVRIYEACNFQDLSGQRIAKVIAALGELEERLTAMQARCSALVRAGGAVPAGKTADGLLNGPKLDGDSGHASQRDIDALFS